MSVLLSTKGLGLSPRLAPVDLQIETGEFVGLIGPNGAGKSTLMRAAMGLITAQGHSSIAALPLTQRPRHAAYLGQHNELVWPLACDELVALGWRANPDHRGNGLEPARGLLADLGLAAFASRPLPQLSGGERARVLMARALAQGAPLLVADEPCAALDPAQAAQMAALLRAKADAGGAVFASMHDLPLAARYCTRLIVLQRGHLVAQGQPSDLAADGCIRSVFGVGLEQHATPTGTYWAVTP